MRGLLLSVALLSTLSCEGPAQHPQARAARQPIVGGVDEENHQYVVAVGDSSGPFCSGTLISKRTVITAGHCYPGITRVYFETGHPTVQQTINVTKETRNPGFDNNTLLNDLTVLQLASDAPAQPVALLRETMANTPDFIGPRFAFAGYGNSNGVTQQGFGTRRVAVFPIDQIGPNTNITQPAQAPASAVTSIVDTQFYYRYPNKNTCNGDSGGPAFIVRNGVERHAGTTSYGDDDCIWDGVQARTDGSTLTWIQQQIDIAENNDPCRSDGTCNASCVSTTPAPLGSLTDPDCAETHCGADGVCVWSCFIVDPDCATSGADNCLENGICQPNCATADPDCSNLGVGYPCTGTGQCASGFCTNGTCCSTACTGDCEACSIAAGATVDGTCAPKLSSTVCRPDAGVCDVAEACDGVNGTCPIDAHLPSTTVCRPSAGACDLAEACSGNGADCPADTFAPASQACRPADGGCDVADYCSGASIDCPTDAYAPSSQVCRPAASSCDVAESCTGSSASCPTDQTGCGGSGGGAGGGGSGSGGGAGATGGGGGAGGGGTKKASSCGCSSLGEASALGALAALLRRRRARRH